jgi:hypothetical protein
MLEKVVAVVVEERLSRTASAHVNRKNTNLTRHRTPSHPVPAHGGFLELVAGCSGAPNQDGA